MAGERRAVESTPYDDRRNEDRRNEDRRNTAGIILVWVGIVAGVVFLVAVVFFSGFFLGRNSSDHFRGGYHQPGMMGPSQMGPYSQMGPGGMPGPAMMGPGGMMGPGMMGPGGTMGPGQQPTTTAPASPRP